MSEQQRHDKALTALEIADLMTATGWNYAPNEVRAKVRPLLSTPRTAAGQRIADVLEPYAHSYDRMEAPGGGSVAYDIRHNMIPALQKALGEVRSAGAQLTPKDWDQCDRCGAAFLTTHPEADPSVVAEQRAGELAAAKNARRYLWLRRTPNIILAEEFYGDRLDEEIDRAMGSEAVPTGAQINAAPQAGAERPVATGQGSIPHVGSAGAAPQGKKP